MSAALTSRASFSSMWEASSRTIRELRLALVSRLGSSKSWLRRPCFVTYRKIARKLLMRHRIVVLGVILNMYRCSLARATGPFSSQGSFGLVEVSGWQPVGWHNQFLGPPL